MTQGIWEEGESIQGAMERISGLQVKDLETPVFVFIQERKITVLLSEEKYLRKHRKARCYSGAADGILGQPLIQVISGKDSKGGDCWAVASWVIDTGAISLAELGVDKRTDLPDLRSRYEPEEAGKKLTAIAWGWGDNFGWHTLWASDRPVGWTGGIQNGKGAYRDKGPKRGVSWSVDRNSQKAGPWNDEARATWLLSLDNGNGMDLF